MRILLLNCFLGVLLTSSAVLRADEPAQAIIDKAVRAAGGDEKLGQHLNAAWKETGTFYGMGEGLPFTGAYAMQLPDQFSMDIQGAFRIIVNRDKGWIRSTDGTRDMTKDELAEQKESLYASYISCLTPLRRINVKTSVVPDEKIEDKNLVGVRVTHDDHRDVELFFDKESGLLVRMKHRTRAPELGGKEVNQQFDYSNYQDIDGAKVAMKITIIRNNEKFVEATMQDYHPGKVDDKEFAKP